MRNNEETGHYWLSNCLFVNSQITYDTLNMKATP